MIPRQAGEGQAEVFVFFGQHFLIRRMKQAMGLAGCKPGSIFQHPGALTSLRSVRDQAFLASQSTRHCWLEKGLSQDSGISGCRHQSCLLLPPALGTPSTAWLCGKMPTCSGGAFPQIQAALASHSPALQGLLCARSWLPADAGGQASTRGTAAPCPRAACSTRAAVPPPPPATMHEERLPVVTNPAESGRRLRCRQSPREIVPRASPQPRGMGTRASLLGPLHPPHAWPYSAGALSVPGWDGK